MLALVALAALSPVYGLNAQDNSRLCLSQAVVHGRLSNNGCFGLDRALYHGREYTDKAPGLSFVELPLAEALHLAPANKLRQRSWKLWTIRILTSGLIFLALAFVIGRVSEGLAPGFGSIVLVTFALGTLIAPFAAMNFDQVPAAALGFGAFLLAWKRKTLLAGLFAGIGVLVEYEAAVCLVVIGMYVALVTRSGRTIGAYVAGALPGLVVLAAYDWLAFGAPWRLSYRYVSNLYQQAQQSGLFGIRLPSWYASDQVFAGRGGLIAATPVVAAAAWGLALLWRERRAEVAVCVSVLAIFLLLNCGYFLPYGGSPGPRFLIPALPFLALGLGPAFARAPRLTAALAAVSIASMTIILLNWGVQTPMRGGLFSEVARLPFQWASSRYYKNLEFTAVDWLAPGRVWGALVTATLAVAAFVVAYRTMPRQRSSREREPLSRRAPWATALVAAGICLVVAAEASAVSGYPYGDTRSDLAVSIQSTSARAFPGRESDFTIWSSNSSEYQGYGNVVLTIELPPGASLMGPPAYERGSGCTEADGASVLCLLGSLAPEDQDPDSVRHKDR